MKWYIQRSRTINSISTRSVSFQECCYCHISEPANHYCSADLHSNGSSAPKFEGVGGRVRASLCRNLLSSSQLQTVGRYQISCLVTEEVGCKKLIKILSLAGRANSIPCQKLSVCLCVNQSST